MAKTGAPRDAVHIWFTVWRVRCAVLMFLVACVHTPPIPRAIVTPGDAHTSGNAILVTPTTCQTRERGLCDLGQMEANATNFAPSPLTLDQYVDPMLRLKLQLAGYTLADATTLKLISAERTDIRTVDGTPERANEMATTNVSVVPTVASLPPLQRMQIAKELGFAGELRSHLDVVRAGATYSAPIRIDLTVVLVDPETEKPVWTVTCSDIYEVWAGTLLTLGNCVGDGVLAWRAPEAVIRRSAP